MGNAHVKPHPRQRNKKQVHWRAADRPSAPGKPHLVSENELTADLVTIRWTKPVRDGGSPITGYLVEHRRTGSPHWVRATPLLVPFPELTLSGLEPGWRYQFRVCAENAVGLSDPSEISEPLTVTLQKFAITSPKFTDELKDVTALENEKVEFIVHFLGQPMPKVCWFKDGFEIFSSRRTRILTESDKSILTIHQSALADEGEIKCTATNKAGHASTKARLTLEAPPSIRLPRQYEDGLLFEIGEVLRLKVSVAGRPTPLIFWSHNGETIQNNDRYEIEYIDKSAILKLGEALRSDRGEYQIKAVNKIGEDVASFLVTITDKPSPPGKARVVMTLGRSVTLSWNLPHDDGGCKIGNYIVEYYRLGWNVWLKAATSRQLTTILGDLIEGSEYKFRVKAESPYGVSDPSEESDIVFIPDAKRGITSPEARSKSQPKDIIDEIIPVAAKRRGKPQPRSQSSTSKVEGSFYDDEEIPIRPERTKIKSPPKTPEPPRKDLKTIIDRASIARELSYGSPEIKEKRTELDIPVRKVLSLSTTSSERSQTASPISKQEEKSPSPSIPSRTPSPNTIGEKVRPSERRTFVREHSENLGGSSEFMLVLYSDAEKDQSRITEFDFDDSIPPPISLSAPELGVEPPLFENLRPSASSSELLHERAMQRLHDEATAEEEEFQKRRRFSFDAQRSVDIPKIQINSKDDQDIVGLERKASRRRSSGSIIQQQLMWAQQRFNMRKSNDLSDLIETKMTKTANKPTPLEEKREMTMTRQRSESEEKEEQEFEKVRARMALQGQSSFEKRSIEVVDEDKWMEEYEESLSEEEETESSEDERNFDEEPPTRRFYSDEDEDVYHPGVMASPRKPISDEPFEILTKKNKLPDPNFIPKPILKKTEDKPNIIKEPGKEMATTNNKMRSHSPMPQYRQVADIYTSEKEDINEKQRTQTLAHQPAPPPPPQPNKSTSLPTQTRSRSDSLTATTEEVSFKDTLANLVPVTGPVSPGHNISAVAQLCGIAIASIVIPDGLLKKSKDAEEARAVVDHYGDIVKNVAQRKKSLTQPIPRQVYETDEKEVDLPLPIAKKLQEQTAKAEVKPVVEKPIPQPIVKPAIQPEVRKEIVREVVKPPPQETKQKELDFYRRERSLSPSPSPHKRSPTPQRGRAGNRRIQKNSTKSRTPSKSPSRLENWSGRSQRKTSPSPMKRNASVQKRKSPSPSPIPYAARPKPPMLREIMTQTSVGLEFNFSNSSSQTSASALKHEELLAKAEVKVRSVFEYITDLSMFCVACWLYLFNNELFAIPLLLIMVYRQLKDGIRKRIPKWILRRFNKTKTKQENN